MLNIANKRKNCKNIRFCINSGFPISFLSKLSTVGIKSAKAGRQIRKLAKSMNKFAEKSGLSKLYKSLEEQ